VATDPHRQNRGERGQASVELIGVFPALLVAILIAAQLVAAGAALWSASLAARAGARASVVGRDATDAARRALPAPLRRGARVAEHGGISVRVGVPRLIPGLPAIRVGAKTSLEASDG
jgi:hypothetical protein